MLLDKSDTSLELAEVIEFSGILYAERLQVWAKWDIFTDDPRSQKVIMRHSYKIVWLSQPFAVWRLLEQMVHNKYDPELDTEPAWYRAKKDQYLVGLENGDYELPSERPYWETGAGDDTHEGGF